MSNVEIILTGLALAFCWVKYVNMVKVKPFNCIKCMAGWFSMVIYILYSYPWHMPILQYYGVCLLFLAAGVFAGAMFEAITMRWL